MIARAIITNQNGNKFPLFDLNSSVNFIRLFAGDLDVLFDGNRPLKGRSKKFLFSILNFPFLLSQFIQILTVNGN